jgi:hypothetical protein
MSDIISERARGLESGGESNHSQLRWWCYLPIVCATLVATSQIYLAEFRDLTPAKGGGFGLFSTVDKLVNRNLRAYLITDEQEIPFAIPRFVPASQPLRKPIYRAASLPSDRHLRIILQDLLDKPYEVPIRGVRVEVWKMSFDAETLTASRLEIKQMTLNGGGDVTD